DHGVGHFAEAGDISAQHEVVGFAEFGSGLGTTAIYVRHDRLESAVHLFEGPLLHTAILCHLQLTGGHTSRIGCLARAISDSGIKEAGYSLRRGWHVGPLA